MPTILKDTLIRLKVSTSTKQLLAYAAGTKSMTLPSFVISCAIKEATDLLSNKTQFALSEAQWQAFNRILDRPARKNLKFKNLFKSH